MTTVTLDVPDILAESLKKNPDQIKTDAQCGFIIWEYLNGMLSLHECGALLEIGYRGFLELLWSKGIPIDGLNENELNQQLIAMRRVMDQQ